MSFSLALGVSVSAEADGNLAVIDNGTGWTKMGFAGNSEPSEVMPTAIATRGSGPSGNRPAVPSKPSALSGSSNLASKRGIDDLDFYIGHEAHEHSKSYSVDYPIKHGLIENWDHMERCMIPPSPRRPAIQTEKL